MKRIVSWFLIVLVFSLGLTAVKSQARVDPMPGECFAPAYANWAAPYCSFWIICFVYHACATTPDDLEQSTVPSVPAQKEPKAIKAEPGDADGTSG